MKKIITLIFLTGLMVSCKQNKKIEAENSPTIHTELYGNWVGNFIAKTYKENSEFVYSNKINIKITNISPDGKITAISIVAGNKRRLTGTFDSTLYKVVLKEPGTDKYDGEFKFTFSGNSIHGEWNAYDTSIPVTKRIFNLTKMQFVYNETLMLPDEEAYVDYYNSKMQSVEIDSGLISNEKVYRSASDKILKINASTTLLIEDSLKNLKKLDLEIIRNTIFARHGYTFKKKGVRQFFDPVEWYVPMFDDVKDKLTEIEIKNIALLSRFEKYAEDNYDSFGR